MRQPQTPPPRTPLYAHASPYPEAGVTERNPQYAHLMNANFASSQGEMSAIAQYLYQHWIFAETDRDFAAAIREITVVEMRHMDLFGELTVLLGGNPQLRVITGDRPAFWSGSAPFYGRGLREALRANLRGEEQTILRYRRQATMIQDEKVRACLERVLLDEEMHRDFFAQKLQQLENGS